MKNFWQQLPRPFLALAPMDSVTDVAFRQVLTNLPRPDVFFTEFTNVTGLHSPGREKTLERLEFTSDQHPIVAQIWGTNPEHFYLSAQLVQEMGFDGVDINMGCPDKNVMKGGAGSALIQTPDLAVEIIQAVKKGAPKIPVSVKTRLGYNKVVTEKWASVLFEQDIATLTMHGRIAKEMSKFPADWEEIGKVVALRDKIAPQTVVVGNGDVGSFSQAFEHHQQYGVDGVMIGRGLFANPWVFSKAENNNKKELRFGTKKERLRILLLHVQLHQDRWSKRRFAQLKKFFKMYVKDFPGASELRAKLMGTSSAKEVIEVLKTEI